jgi:hypothetical protein
MQVQAIHGYFNNGNFYQQGRRVALPERQMVIVNVLDMPVDVETIKNADIDFLKEFDRLADGSFNEELRVADFPRTNFRHEPLLFENEV